jgi:endonuclease/exonuclease/phosphatase family metal-dependent hydrolase
VTAATTLKVASYNIRKAIGLDRRRDPARIMAVLGEIGADIVALQEADRRFGSRASAIPLPLLNDHGGYMAVALDGRAHSIGWHGNALLIRREIVVEDCHALHLPTLEPRGAVAATLQLASGLRVRAVGMHLDLSGIRRRQQARAILHHVEDGEHMPTILMGDLNEWRPRGGCLADFGEGHTALATGHSFHSRRPVARLDRIFASPDLTPLAAGTHRSALAARASDHLPVWAELAAPLLKK